MFPRFPARQHLFLFYFVLAISSFKEQTSTSRQQTDPQQAGSPAHHRWSSSENIHKAQEHLNEGTSSLACAKWSSLPVRASCWQAGRNSGGSSAPYRTKNGILRQQLPCATGDPMGWKEETRTSTGQSARRLPVTAQSCGVHLQFVPTCHQALAIMFRITWDEEPNAVNGAWPHSASRWEKTPIATASLPAWQL